MKIVFSKPAIWFYSLFISIAVALVLEITVIGTEEYAQFDNSTKAKNEARLLKSIQASYFPSIIVLHLLIVIRFLVKYYKKMF
ncbi:hypothetical protein [Guptibacillus hwajinpoensis]|uniref:Uncharacterized protein n=1 Tax=Guptibacillus hwajinpoensis TaxID=208199 RepID=A0A0J6FVQ1_9BACL|nr:hypothetical protein [Alkalihalobacillus macyae]KMM38447.1 hypothetical protein AB986_03885 [Alkalihalobacillus macyae]